MRETDIYMHGLVDRRMNNLAPVIPIYSQRGGHHTQHSNSLYDNREAPGYLPSQVLQEVLIT